MLMTYSGVQTVNFPFFSLLRNVAMLGSGAEHLPTGGIVRSVVN